jgi:hypothetical protein
MDLSIVNSLLVLREELQDHVNELLMSSPGPQGAAKDKGAPGVAPTLDTALLRRIEKERETVLTALGRMKLTTETTLQELLRAASAPLPAVEEPGSTPSVATPSVAAPSAAKPKAKPKPNAKKP